MKALFFDKKLLLVGLPDPVPAEGEVLVRVRVSSICNTDLEIIRGYMGFTGVPGHEFVGEVVTPNHPLSGKRIVGEINCPCGHCYLCKTSRRRHCFARTVTGIAGHQGVFADFIALPAENLHVVPDHLSDEKAVFTEPLAAAVEILTQLHIPPGTSTFIFGAGKLGSLISMVFRLQGIDYTTFDIQPAKRAIASSLGIAVRDPATLGPDEKAEVCVDCTGNPAGILLALDHLWPGGTLVLKTTVAQTAPVDLNQLVINEYTVVGSRCGPFQPALKLLSDELIDPTGLISATVSFHEIIQGFNAASAPETMKVLINHAGGHIPGYKSKKREEFKEK